MGILAAAAIPKFANLTSQAAVAANRGVGGLASAASIAHAAWIAGGALGAASSNITLDNGTTQVNGYGWPAGGIATASPATPTATAASCVTAVLAMLNSPPTITIGACAASASNCYTAIAATSVCTFTLANAPVSDHDYL